MTLQWVTDCTDLIMGLTNYVAQQYIFTAKLKDGSWYIVAATHLQFPHHRCSAKIDRSIYRIVVYIVNMPERQWFQIINNLNNLITQYLISVWYIY